jgi:hypothetical protein
MKNLVLWPQARGGPEALCHQTPSLATSARNCDHIATMPHVTHRDSCPTRTGDTAVAQHQRGREGTSRTGGDG